MKVAVYARVSTSKESQASSYENQLSYFKNKIEKEGNTLYHLYGDEGLTGTNLKREQFIKMLYDAGLDMLNINSQEIFVLSKRKPKFDIIYTKSTSRLARNTGILEIIKLLKQKNVVIYFEDLNKSTNDVDASLLINLMILLDEQYSKDLSVKTRFGKRESNKRNLNKMRLLGYKKVDNEVIIIPEEADIVKYIFNEYINTDKGTYLIAKDLNKKGYRGINGKEFVGTTINGILHNRKYTGCYVANKRYTNKIDKINRKNDEKDWIVRENAFEAIIDKETFDKAQEKLKLTAIGEKIFTSNNKYGTHLKCGICGGNTQLRKRKNRRDRYVCTMKRKQGPSGCKGPYVLDKDIDSYINNVLKRIEYYYTGEIFWGIRKLNEEKKNIKAVEDVKIQKERLVDLYVNGLVDKDIYESKLKMLEEDLLINEKLEKINDKIEQLKELRDIKLPTTPQELLSISTLYINEDKSLSIKFNIREEVENIVNS